MCLGCLVERNIGAIIRGDNVLIGGQQDTLRRQNATEHLMNKCGLDVPLVDNTVSSIRHVRQSDHYPNPNSKQIAMTYSSPNRLGAFSSSSSSSSEQQTYAIIHNHNSPPTPHCRANGIPNPRNPQPLPSHPSHPRYESRILRCALSTPIATPSSSPRLLSCSYQSKRLVHIPISE